MKTTSGILPELGKKQLTKKTLTEVCPECNLKFTLVAEVQSRCFEIFGLPFFPVRKELSVHCSNCSYQSNLESLPENLKDPCTEINHNTSIPVGNFKGLFFLILIVILIWGWFYRSPGVVALLENPRVGDLYITYIGTDSPSYAMVMLVRGNTVYLSFHNDYPDSLYDELYSSQFFLIDQNCAYYSKERLVQLYEEGFILNVVREKLPVVATSFQKDTTTLSRKRAPSGNERNKAAPADK